jgi:hypothetical protein
MRNHNLALAGVVLGGDLDFIQLDLRGFKKHQTQRGKRTRKE